MRTRWRRDGPRLPIEFARISQDQRLTLVIHPESEKQPTWWCLSSLTSLGEARKNLREREGNVRDADIHSLTKSGKSAGDVPESIKRTISSWLSRQGDNVSAVVWTGLCSNWQDKMEEQFSVENAVAYLRKLEGEKDQAKTTFDRAREYMRNAPPDVQTKVRKEMQKHGWTDAPLSSILFEA